MDNLMERLIYAAKKLKNAENDSQVARVLGVSEQTFWNWHSRGISKEGLIAAEMNIGCSVKWLITGEGPMDINAIEQGASGDNQSGGLAEVVNISIGKKIEIERNSALFQVLDVKAACGDGAVNSDYPETVRTLVMSLEEAQRLIGSTNKHDHIKIIIASKDSMIPTIFPDDLLFVDTSVKEYIGESVYVLLHGEELVCKRLSLAGETVIVSSDNKAYPIWNWEERSEHTRIIGKVLRVLPMNFKKFGA